MLSKKEQNKLLLIMLESQFEKNNCHNIINQNYSSIYNMQLTFLQSFLKC